MDGKGEMVEVAAAEEDGDTLHPCIFFHYIMEQFIDNYIFFTYYHPLPSHYQISSKNMGSTDNYFSANLNLLSRFRRFYPSLLNISPLHSILSCLFTFPLLTFSPSSFKSKLGCFTLTS